MSAATPIDYRLTMGAAICRLDAVATRRVRVMLRTQSWRDVMGWLKALDRETEGMGVDELLVLAGRVERGER